MFRDRHHKLRSCSSKEARPGISIEPFGSEQGNKIFIAKARLWAIRLYVVSKDRRILKIHIARIPLAAKGRNGIDAPVNKDAEFGIFVPARHAICLERLPVGGERAISDDALYPVLRFRDAITICGHYCSLSSRGVIDHAPTGRSISNVWVK